MPITNAKEWKSQQSRRIELELPSGLTVAVRRPPLHMWITAGKLPENLVKAMLAQRSKQALEESSMTPEQFKELFTFMREVIVATVVEPRIVEGATAEDEIDPEDVPLDDAMFIFQWALSGGALPAHLKAQQQREQQTLSEGKVQIDVSDLQRFRTF
jgi:hypothetical protein